jgi:hypothetical protein
MPQKEAVDESAIQEKIKAGVEATMKEGVEARIKEEVAEFNNALRHVEDIVRNDVKGLADIIDTLQKGLSMSTERIDDIFDNLRNNTKEQESRELVTSASNSPPSPLSPKSDRGSTESADAGTKTSSAPPKENEPSPDVRKPSADVSTMAKPSSPPELKPSSPSAKFVSSSGLEVSLQAMRNSVQQELDSLRASILDTVRAKIDAGVANANARGGGWQADRSGTADIAMFVRCPPPTVNCCASCNTPLPPSKVMWPKEHPVASGGSFPSRPPQKAMIRAKTQEAFHIKNTMEPQYHVTTFDVGQFLPKLPPLPTEPPRGLKEELPRNFKRSLSKHKSLPTLPAQVPGVVNLGADFDRSKVQKMRARGVSCLP